MASLIGFILCVSTTGSFLPSFKLILQRRRHFECFVGAGQLISTLLFEISAASGFKLFGIKADEYHHVSDILTETYACLLMIHLMGLRNEDTLHLLRYTAFFLCWFAKLGDGWESVVFEVLVIVAFATPAIALLIYSLSGLKKKKLRYQSMNDRERDGLSYGSSASRGKFDTGFESLNKFFMRSLPYNGSSLLSAAVSVSVGLVLLVLENLRETRLRIFHALAQVAFGLSSYHLWQLLPCFDKDDMIGNYR
ncbi:hypothetical protein TrST_g10336 [Triparma strigata]|uniref:Uncharacterized protein n=1 Tax=Triparma strigata TaxID=1606541 RepID=A0A9W7B4R7_9STRA|nr:hypothetical protein TrST_g10336 [Triparma strigata]